MNFRVVWVRTVRWRLGVHYGLESENQPISVT